MRKDESCGYGDVSTLRVRDAHDVSPEAAQIGV